MAQYTDKLELRLIQPTDQFADESFNRVIRDADDKLVGVGHLTSGAHWEVWDKTTAYSKGDVVRWPNMHSHQYARCQEAGDSGTAMPTNNVTGSVVIDGTVKWQIESLTESTENGGRILIWTSGSYYGRGDAVYYGKALYRCKIAHQANTFSSDVGNWQEIYASIRPWVASTYYIEDDAVLVNSDLYVCKTNHTSGNSFNNVEKADWDLIGSFGLVSEWNPSTSYHIGQIVTFGNVSYICINEHESDNVDFSNDITKWKLFNASVVPWGLSSYYSLNTLVIYDSKVWRCVLAHANTTNVFEDTQVNWIPLGYNLPAYLKAWQPNTYYYANQTVLIESKYLYRCALTHTSATDWASDETNWIRLGGIEGVIKNWESGVRYYPNQLVTYLGTLYRAVAIHDSGNSFADDVNEWRRINANIGFWEVNVYYPLGHLVEYNQMIYRCITAHTSTNIFDNTKWVSILALPVIEDWQVSTNYLAGQLVLNSGMLLRAVDTHTSDSSSLVTDISNSHWELVYANIAPWQADTIYEVGSQVIYNNNIYRCTTTHTSGNDFAIANWVLIGQTDAFMYNWQANKYYYANQVVVVDKELWRNNTAHTSASNWNDDKNNWTKISDATLIEPWADSTEYLINQVVVINGILYRCISPHTSGASFDTSKWTPVYANIVTWQAGTDYRVGELVLYNNQLYRCLEAHTSSNLYGFENDGSKWQPIANNIAGLPAWTSGVFYYPNQVVKYDGKIYRCLIAHTSGAEEKPDYIKKFESNEQFLHYDEDYALPFTDVPKDHTIDIGYVTKVNKIRLEYGGRYIGVNASVKISSDGINYTTLDTRTYSNSGSHEIDFYADARYVRVTANSAGPSGVNGSISFYYLGVWGDSNKWEVIYDPSIKITYWAQSTKYKTNDIVIYENEFYKCIETHKSSNTFDDTKWRKIPDIVIPDWKSGEAYKVNQVVFYDDKLYKCINAHTSGSTFTQANWLPVNDIVDNWTVGKNYYVGQMVWYNYSLYKALVAHKSDSDSTPVNKIGYINTGIEKTYTDTSTLPVSLVIDLGEVHKINNMSFEFANNNAGIIDLSVDFSEDGVIYDEHHNQVSTWVSDYNKDYSDYSQDIYARYVRIVVNGIDIASTLWQIDLKNLKIEVENIDNWEEVSTMNTLTDEEIDDMFI